MTSLVSAQELAIDWLRRAVVTGTLRPGDRIRQEEVAAALEISVIPVREALRILEGEGQVTYRPRRGYAVRELSYRELADCYDMRALLEAEAVRRAVPRLTEEDDARVREAAAATARASAAGDVAAAGAANRRLHFALFEPAGSAQLMRLIRLLWESSEPYRAMYNDAPEVRAAIDREHEGIVAALAARDAALLVARLDAHRDGALAFLRALLDDH